MSYIQQCAAAAELAGILQVFLIDTAASRRRIDPLSDPAIQHQACLEATRDEGTGDRVIEVKSGDCEVNRVSNHGSTSPFVRYPPGRECRYPARFDHRIPQGP